MQRFVEEKLKKETHRQGETEVGKENARGRQEINMKSLATDVVV